MIAKQIGNLIKRKRESVGINQDVLARHAAVSRDVVSRLECGRAAAVQSDTVDKLLLALQMKVQVQEAGRDPARLIARLEQQRVADQRRERHLRLAVELACAVGSDAKLAQAKIDQAKSQVELWRQNKLCSPLYIRRWKKILMQSPKGVARAMSSFGAWEAAMFQNSPWI